jgi:hypothetical protein
MYLLVLTSVVFPSIGHTDIHVMGSPCRHALQPRTVYSTYTIVIVHMHPLRSRPTASTQTPEILVFRPRLHTFYLSPTHSPSVRLRKSKPTLCTTSKKKNHTLPNPSTPLSGPIRIGSSRGVESTNSNICIPDPSPTAYEGGLHGPWGARSPCHGPGALPKHPKLKISLASRPASGLRLLLMFSFVVSTYLRAESGWDCGIPSAWGQRLGWLAGLDVRTAPTLSS